MVLFGVLLGAVAALQLSNIWRLSLYPFTDLPNHLAEAYLVRALANPADALHAYYRLNITALTPNSLHALFCALFPDVEAGNRVFYSLYIVGLFAGALLVLKYGGGDLWAALLASLFLWNYSVMWGFTGYMLGIALLLLDLSLLARFIEQPTVRRALPLALLTLLLFYAHAQAFLLAIAVIGVAVVARRGFHLKHYLLGLATLLPSLIVMGLWIAQSPSFSQEESTTAFLLAYYRHNYLATVPGRFVRLPGNDNLRLAAGTMGGVIGALFVLAVILIGGALLVAAVRRWRRSGNARAAMRQALAHWTFFETPARVRTAATPARAARYTVLVFFLIALACYFVLPDDLPHHNAIFVRISVLVFLGFSLIIGLMIPPAARRPVRALITIIVLAHAMLWFGYFSRFDLAAEPFRELMWHSPWAQEKTLAAMIDADPAELYWRAFPHYQSYQTIWNHGATPTKIVEQRFPLIQAQSDRALPRYREWVYTDTNYPRLLQEYAAMDLLLVHGANSLAAVQAHGGYEMADRRAEWLLFRRVVP